MEISVQNMEDARMEWKTFFHTSIPIPYQFCALYLQKNTYRCRVVINNIVTKVLNFNIYLGFFFFGHLSVIDRFFCAMTEIFLVCSIIITENFFTTANTIFAGL